MFYISMNLDNEYYHIKSLKYKTSIEMTKLQNQCFISFDMLTNLKT